MKFILELWPEEDEGTPQEWLADAIESAASNPCLVWDIVADDGTPIATGIRVVDGVEEGE